MNEKEEKQQFLGTVKESDKSKLLRESFGNTPGVNDPDV